MSEAELLESIKKHNSKGFRKVKQNRAKPLFLTYEGPAITGVALSTPHLCEVCDTEIEPDYEGLFGCPACGGIIEGDIE